MATVKVKFRASSVPGKEGTSAAHPVTNRLEDEADAVHWYQE